MPYSGIEPGSETEKKLERCVRDVMSDGKDKSGAIAICRASMGASMNDTNAAGSVTAGLTLVPAQPQDLQGLEIAANQDIGRILKFDNAVVARRERNANGDGLLSESLHQLAATLPLMPLDVDHKRKQIMGMFTTARVEEWKKKDGSVVPEGQLTVGGIIFAANYPDEAEEVMSGARKLSIYATARKVVCSECQKVCTSPKDYCEHLRNPVQSGTTRYLFDMTALGAGTTKNPAGTDTAFDTENGLLMIAEILPSELAAEHNTADWLESELHRALTNIADGLFGDGKITREERIALSNAIGSALNLFHEKLQGDDLKGLYDKKVWAMADQENAEEAKQMEELQRQLAELQARIAELEASNKTLSENHQTASTRITQMEADAATQKAENERLVAENTQLKERLATAATSATEQAKVAASRVLSLSTVLKSDRLQELVPQLAGMDEATFKVVAEVAEKTKEPPASVVVADDTSRPDKPVTLKDLFA